jgi:hypothetical protein
MMRSICVFVFSTFVLPSTLSGQELLNNGTIEPQSPLVSSPFVEATAAYEPELERTNYLDLGFSTEALFDDNLLGTQNNTKSDVSYIVSPNIGIRQSRGRLDWKLRYAGGITIHQQFDSYNQGSHDFDGRLSYKVAPHVDLTVSDRYLKMSGLFNQLQTQAPSTSSLLQQPNQSVVTPIANQSSNVGLVQINNQFSANSAVGASASFLRLRFGQRPAGWQLFDTNSIETEGYFNHRISAKNMLGLMYRFQRFSFEPNNGNTTANTLLATYGFRVQKHTVVTLFVGPQYLRSTLVSSRSNAGSPNKWSPAVGASFELNGIRTGLAASVSRTASDGGGLLSTVNLTAANIIFRIRFSRAWSGELGGAYGFANSVTSNTAVFSKLKNTSGHFGVNRRIAMWDVGVGYTRIFQSENSGLNGNADVRHNSAWLSISYQMSHALGRD